VFSRGSARGSRLPAARQAGALSGVSPHPAPSATEDCDGDGLPDAWEAQYGLNPGDPNDANQDTDRDGVSNLHEYLSGTEPNNPESYLHLARVELDGNDVVLEFTAVEGKTYSVLYRESAAEGTWSKLADVPAQPATQTIHRN
jgi:hypothetical protein